MIKMNKNALKCPNCGAKISIGQKSFLLHRNNYSRRCKSCGVKCKVPTWANLNLLINALIFIIPAAFIRPPLPIIIILIGVYWLLTSIIGLFFIPIVCKE